MLWEMCSCCIELHIDDLPKLEPRSCVLSSDETTVQRLETVLLSQLHQILPELIEPRASLVQHKMAWKADYWQVIKCHNFTELELRSKLKKIKITVIMMSPCRISMLQKTARNVRLLTFLTGDICGSWTSAGINEGCIPLVRSPH